VLESIERISAELAGALDGVSPEACDKLFDALGDRRRRWFFTGQGRSGLVAAMAAMRFTHLGYRCHVVGEATVPAIANGDALLVISASGETPITCSLARISKLAGADVFAVSRSSASTLVGLADTHLIIPADDSVQFGGSLFEQAALVVLDAVALSLADQDPDAHAAMARRHTNLQ
jgi:6-phospho-3-hexuloisomerase